jgi:hypothetical protein
MVKVAVHRYFHCGYSLASEAHGQVFKTGSQWAGFARLQPHIEQAILDHFGPERSWNDAVHSFQRELWKGEYDADCGAMAWSLRDDLEGTPRALCQRLKETFRPLARLFIFVSCCETPVLLQPSVTVAESALLGTPERAGAASSLADTHSVPDGDVTDRLAALAKEPAEKKLLVDNMNRDERQRRDSAISTEVHRQAAVLVRSRVRIASSAEEVKRVMETHPGGLTARVVVIDVTMPRSRQTKARSKNVCKRPNKELQKKWASEVKATSPPSPGSCPL